MRSKKAKPKPKRKRRMKRKVAKRKAPKRKRQTSTALVTVAPAPLVRREHGLRPEQVALLKRTVAKDTTNDEFALFMLVARKHKLDALLP